MTLATQLKYYREQNGFSQNTVAEKLCISRQSISKWENDRGYPDLDNLVLLSQLYQVSIDELLRENNELRKQIDTNNEELIEKKRQLKYIKRNIHQVKDEGMVLLIISAISSFIFPVGFVTLPVVLFRNKKSNTLYQLVYIVALLALFLNIYSGYVHLANYMNWGTVTVERIK